MAFVGDCGDVAMLEDVLVALLDLLRRTPAGRLPLLPGFGGAQLFVSLLGREQPGLRILGLHALAHLVPYMHAAGGAPSLRFRVFDEQPRLCILGRHALAHLVPTCTQRVGSHVGVQSLELL